MIKCFGHKLYFWRHFFICLTVCYGKKLARFFKQLTPNTCYRIQATFDTLGKAFFQIKMLRLIRYHFPGRANKTVCCSTPHTISTTTMSSIAQPGLIAFDSCSTASRLMSHCTSELVRTLRWHTHASRWLTGLFTFGHLSCLSTSSTYQPAAITRW